MFASSTKREIRYFHVEDVQWRQKNMQKSVMHVQSCCFAYLNLFLFCRSRCRRCRRWLSSLLSTHVRRKQPSGPKKSQSKNASLACDVIAFLFFAFYSFSGGQFMASNGWTLIPIYLTVSNFSCINRMFLCKNTTKYVTSGKPDDWKHLTWGKLPFTKRQTCKGASGTKLKYHSYLCLHDASVGVARQMVEKFSDRLGWNSPWKKGNSFEDFDFCGKFWPKWATAKCSFSFANHKRSTSKHEWHIPSANRGETHVLSPSWLRDKTEGS